MFKLSILSFSVVLTSTVFATSIPADICPKTIALKNPRFFNQQFPVEHQVIANLNQNVHDTSGTPAWDNGDLQAAMKFVKTFQSENHNNQLVLHPNLTNTDLNYKVCAGIVGQLKYSVKNLIDGLGANIFIIIFDEINHGRNWVSILAKNSSAVQFDVGLPGNCSNCSSRAELFKYQQVVVIEK